MSSPFKLISIMEIWESMLVVKISIIVVKLENSETDITSCTNEVGEVSGIFKQHTEPAKSKQL